jgi:hypothetical protein
MVSYEASKEKIKFEPMKRHLIKAMKKYDMLKIIVSHEARN